MAYSNILYEKQRQGVLITLNRPEQMNALSAELRDELHQAFDEAAADPEVRAIVLTGAGRAFSAGAAMGGGDAAETVWPSGLPEGTSVAAFLDRWRTADQLGMRRLLHMWELPKPVIGAINGWALGAGSWYALTTHLTIASEQAVFAQPEVRHISNTNFIWTLLAGFKNALLYGLTGDHIDAYEALRIGLVNKVVPHEQLLDECFRIVERIALVSPETVKLNLAVATKGLEMMGLYNAWSLNAELASFAHTSMREEFRRHLDEARQQGGMRAYIATRDAPFQPEPFGPRSQPRERTQP
jgi:enoyl-CoA hydratase/carnithine racemase